MPSHATKDYMERGSAIQGASATKCKWARHLWLCSRLSSGHSWSSGSSTGTPKATGGGPCTPAHLVGGAVADGCTTLSNMSQRMPTRTCLGQADSRYTCIAGVEGRDGISEMTALILYPGVLYRPTVYHVFSLDSWF